MRKLNYVLLSALVYCMVNPLYVWTQTSTTLSICPGESIFLPAIQAFPTPPQPPQGPDGSIPATPCTPQLNEISILPVSNSLENSLSGFTVNPTETTSYTVTSNGLCGGPGSAFFGEESVTYEVVVLNNCGTPTIDATLIICQGESAFLEAIQTFPTPPQPPQGPDGSFPITPCTPQLNGINILPLNNVATTSLAGFTVSPTETTIYTITSDGICGGPGSAGFGEETITYEVVVDNNCAAPPAPIDATLIICQGESAFLEAIQTFPTPPQPPQGPDGSFPITPCTPQLNGINILPLNNVATTSLAGFTVSPTETTIYTITSDGICGGPGSAGFGEETITYEVVVDNDCGVAPPPIDATLIICQGQSAFLEAIQTFPTPPQPPQGPDGSFPITPCTPMLSEVSIVPTTNTISSALTGFTVSPTETTIYTVTSNGICGGPGSANFGVDAITYEVVVDNTCGATEPTSVINKFPWLTGLFDPSFCNGESVVVYQQGDFQYLLVSDGVGNEQLYFENGDLYCQGSPTYDCVAAYGFTTEAGRWNCGDAVTDCVSNYGTFFFDDCNGQTFFFIRLDDGRIFDPYFADVITFNPQEGQTIMFDFTIADFSTPCTIAEEAIIITCLTIVPSIDSEDGTEIEFDELTIASIFPQYSSWIGALIDVNNCQGETVTVYSKGGYDFILIKDADGVERLYLEDGTFYCENTATYDCMVAYGFEDMLSYWECNFDSPVDPDVIFTDYPWLNDLVITEGCATELVQVYESGGYHYLLVTTNGVASLYFEDGTFYCQNQAGYSCNLAYGFGAPETTWLCGAAFSELPANNLVRTNAVSSLNIYPNPTNGLLNVPIVFSDNNQSLRLIDLYGKTIATRKVSASESVNNITFDLTAYAAGIYYVELTSGKERTVQKVVRR